MLHELKNRTLGLAMALVILIAGGTRTVVGLSDNLAAPETSPAFSASTNLESCQIVPSLDAPCSKANSHSDAASSSHCQQHCGHSQTGMLSELNLTSPDPSHQKVAQNSPNIPESIAFDPGSRPPNL